MKRGLLLGTLLLVSACTSSDDRRKQRLMDEIEQSIRLPRGAHPFAAYARYYAFGGADDVVGTYMLPGLDDRPGQECEQLNTKLTGQPVPCSLPSREGKEVGVGQRAWLQNYWDLPNAIDRSCGSISFDYQLRSHRFLDVRCLGVCPRGTDNC
jgi:hypothetical protein